MGFDFALRKLVFVDGTTLPLSTDAIVAIVGPNNAGKSTVLRDVIKLVSRRGDSKVLQSVELETAASAEDVVAWLQSTAFHSGAGNRKTFKSYDVKVDADQAPSNFQYIIGELPEKSYLDAGQMPEMLCLWLKAEKRLAAATSTTAPKDRHSPPENPIQHVYKNDKSLSQVNAVLRQAFGAELVLDYRGGAQINVHWGQTPQLLDSEERLSDGYLERVRALPLLEDQGDGVRSFVGVVLHVLLSPHPIVLVDEPEAFLHPPQARQLGRFLAQRRRYGQQVFVATHSADVLHGLLDVDSAKVSVVRLQRVETGSRVSLLDTQTIRDIWQDPILRHSNVLQSIFHGQTIVCESESDCWFYSSMVEDGTQSADFFFCHSGGKAALYKVARPLRRMGIALSIIADFDLINNEDTLSRLVSALGGKWDSMKVEWKRIASDIQSSTSAPPTIDAVKECITAAIARSKPDSIYLTKQLADQISGCAKFKSGWDSVKRFGENGIPPGAAQVSWQNLNTKLKELGLHLVPVGELESFDRDSGDHGPDWVRNTLERWKNQDQASKRKIAQDFASSVVGQVMNLSEIQRDVNPVKEDILGDASRPTWLKSFRRRVRVVQSDGYFWLHPWNLRAQGVYGVILVSLIIVVIARIFR